MFHGVIPSGDGLTVIPGAVVVHAEPGRGRHGELLDSRCGGGVLDMVGGHFAGRK